MTDDPTSPHSDLATPSPASAVPQAGDATPISVGASAPISVGASAPISVGASAPISVGASAPISVGASAPISVGASAPIGVFDSGVGGLTVAREITRRLPAERILYLADQAHVPYGGRPLAEVASFARALTDYLFRRGAKAVVMACNISSATALAEMRALHGADRVLGVIEPGARAALAETACARIGVLATRGTVASGAYGRAIRALAPGVEPIEVACPDFVPLVEAGEVTGPRAISAAREYLSPVLRAGADTVILGCTHYPYLLGVLREVAPGLRFIDPAHATVTALERALRARAAISRGPAEPHALLTTGDAAAFAAQATGQLPGAVAPVEALAWSAIEAPGCASPHPGGAAGPAPHSG